jgi:agmatine deiminase
MTAMTRPAPAELGFRMPAEWAPHQATWISWPHNPETWPGVLAAAEAAMAQAVQALAGGETVRINVLDAAHEAHVRGLLGPVAATPAVVFHHFPTNDAWCRDHGATFVRDAAGRSPRWTAASTPGAASTRRGTWTTPSRRRWPRRSGCRASRAA